MIVYNTGKKVKIKIQQTSNFITKWLTMFFKTRGRFSVISHRRAKSEMRDDWETSSSFRKHLQLFYRYDSMFIKDLVMWRHYYVILENSDITTRPWQRLAIIWIVSCANVIWNILVLNIKGKINKIAIIRLYFTTLYKIFFYSRN